MTSPIGSLFGHKVDKRTYDADPKWPLPTCYIGLELEFENAVNKDVVKAHINPRLIEFKEDTSLRGPNVELVCAVPCYGGDLTAAIKELEMIVAEFKRVNGADLLLNKRTSLHVHIDVRDLSFEEFRRFKMLGIIFERALIHYCAPEREYNNFCLPTYRAESMRDTYAQLLVNERYLKNYAPQASKYMAINYLPLIEFGSVEFRMHQGTLDMRELREWVSIIQLLKKAAVEMNFQTPTELLVHVSKLGAKELTNQVFGEFAEKLSYPELEADILHGARFVQDLLLYNDLQAVDMRKEDFATIDEAMKQSRTK